MIRPCSTCFKLKVRLGTYDATVDIAATAQQEAIKTLQRTLDRLVTLQEREYAEHHPDSPIIAQVEPPITQAGQYSGAAPYGAPAPYGISAPYGTPAPGVPTTYGALPPSAPPSHKLPHASVPHAVSRFTVVAEPEEESLEIRSASVQGQASQRSSSTDSALGDAELKRKFIERALDVLRRNSSDTEQLVPDVSYDVEIRYS